MNKECKSCGTENYHEFLSCEWCGKAIQYPEEERLVTISNRSVYHKYAEVTIPNQNNN